MIEGEPEKLPDISENPELEVVDAQEHLEKAGREYYQCISTSTPESLVEARSKVEQLYKFIPDAKSIVSVGVGGGEEIHALEEIFPSETQITGLDLSGTAISIAQERIDKNNLRATLIQGSGIDMPFSDESIDGFVMSAILHEIYSYVPDGRAAWRKAIHEVATKLTDNGAFLLRDFAAPQIPGDVTLRFHTEISRDFYNYFRRRYRTFENWSEQAKNHMKDKRSPDDSDFPPIEPESQAVTLPYANAAEALLHFRNFWSDYQAGLTTIGDSDWKEIDEAYLVPNPNVGTVQAMSPIDYVSTVIAEANHALQNTDYQLACVQNETSERPETNTFLARHFTLAMSGLAETNEELIGNTTRKLELVFKKTRKA